MNIQEATKKALEKGCSIHNPHCCFPNIVIKPTNTSKCCVVRVSAKEESPRWCPKAVDLISDDWELYEAIEGRNL